MHFERKQQMTIDAHVQMRRCRRYGEVIPVSADLKLCYERDRVIAAVDN